MAQIPGYDYDIFISYCHKDNRKQVEGAGWVDRFHEELENRLIDQRQFENLEIWRDKKLYGNTEFDEAIKNRLRASALFLALNSRNYQKSDYCKKELDFFCKFNIDSCGSIKFGEERRILNILLNNIPHEEWSEAFDRTGSFPMNDAKRGQEFDDFTEPDIPRFNRQLRKIVDAIHHVFNKFPKIETSETSISSEKNAIRIFVADVSETLQKQHSHLVNVIKNSGAKVIEGIPPPNEREPHASKMEQVLQQVNFSVHILNQWPGRQITDKKDLTYPWEQVEIAQKSQTHHLIWIPKDLSSEDIEDKIYSKYLTSLEKDKREEKNYEFIRGNPSAFSDQVLEKIKELQNLPKNGKKRFKFLVDTHDNDFSSALELCDYLKKQNIKGAINQESFDPVQSKNYFESAVRHVNNLIIMFGKVVPAWVYGRIEIAVKIVAENWQLPLKKIWIVRLPGSKPPDLPPVFDIEVLDNSRSDHLDSKVLTPLLSYCSMKHINE